MNILNLSLISVLGFLQLASTVLSTDTTPFPSTSPVCASYESIDFSLLGIRHPEPSLLTDGLHELEKHSEDLREYAVASGELQIFVAVSQGAFPGTRWVRVMARELEKFTVDLRKAADGVRDVMFDLERFLSVYDFQFTTFRFLVAHLLCSPNSSSAQNDQASIVRQLDLGYAIAKGSFRSRITFGRFVPSFPVVVHKSLANLHGRIYDHIKDTTFSVKGVKTLILACKEDADVIAGIVAKEGLSHMIQVDSSRAQRLSSLALAPLLFVLHGSFGGDQSQGHLKKIGEHIELLLEDIDAVTSDVLAYLDRVHLALDRALLDCFSVCYPGGMDGDEFGVGEMQLADSGVVTALVA